MSLGLNHTTNYPLIKPVLKEFTDEDSHEGQSQQNPSDDQNRDRDESPPSYLHSEDEYAELDAFPTFKPDIAYVDAETLVFQALVSDESITTAFVNSRFRRFPKAFFHYFSG